MDYLIRRAQMRAARALLEWSQERLSQESGVSVATIKRMEPGSGPMIVRLETIHKIQATFVKNGIDFIPENEGGGIGVRLTKAPTLRKPRLRIRSLKAEDKR